jgi:hypothetical protein
MPELSGSTGLSTKIGQKGGKMKKLSVFLCSILLFSASIGTASALTIGNDIIDRPQLDGARNIAFIDPTLVFPTAGTLESFDLWVTAEQGEIFTPQIYRYTGSGDNWELVYSQGWYFASPGSYDTAVTVPAYFNIQAGDVVGWWFGEDAGTIPFTFTGDDDVEWTNYLAAATEIPDPQVGDIYNFDTEEWAQSSQKREYSIAANYTPVPEPATMLLLGLGLAGLAGVSRKKFKK